MPSKFWRLNVGVRPGLLALKPQLVAAACCSALPLVSKVALSLVLSPPLQGLADAVVARMTQEGQRAFNGLHLRMEGDTGWTGRYGLAKVRLQRQAG